MKKEDKSWSIKHEGHLNQKNIEIKKENDKLKERRDANKHVSK